MQIIKSVAIRDFTISYNGFEAVEVLAGNPVDVPESLYKGLESEGFVELASAEPVKTVETAVVVDEPIIPAAEPVTQTEPAPTTENIALFSKRTRKLPSDTI
jgi:hypothetical protein